MFTLFVTENLTSRLASAKLIVDSYVLAAIKTEPDGWGLGKPWFEWPDPLSAAESELQLRGLKQNHFLFLNRPAPKVGAG